MDEMARLIFEQTAAGGIERDVAARLLEQLKKTGGGSQRGDIAVIGLSIRLPGAGSLEELWQNLRDGRALIGPFPERRQKDSEALIRHFTSVEEERITYSYGGYLDEVDRFDHEFFQLSPKEAELMDPNQRLFLEAAWTAIEDAGYGGARLAGSATGVYLGYADWPAYGQYISKKQPQHISIAGAGNTPSLIASRISYLLDLKGPAFVVDTACSSSLVAVHLACRALADGECETAIAGGVKICLMPVEGVFEMGIESSDRTTRAFDDEADGTVWGEGAVALLLKPLARARRDRDRIYAVIKGTAINQDGASAGITAPNAAAQERVLAQAWERAGIRPETLGCIEAHGTGTRLGDPIEADGIRRAFRRYTGKNQFCALGSVKTNIGHLDSAAGVAGLAKAIASLRYQALPPTLNFARPNRNITFESSPCYVNDRLAPWETDGHPRRCGVSSFGFSGTNCHVVLEEAPAQDEAAEAGRERQVLALSAKSRAALEALARGYIGFLRTTDDSLADICYTAGTGRGHYSHRLALAAADKAEALGKLERFVAGGGGFETGAQGAQPDVWAGEHQLVTAARERAKPGRLTAGEQRALSEEAADVVARLRQGDEDAGLPEALCRLYASGAQVDWEALYRGERRSRVQVPGYPFQRVRCWVDTADAGVEAEDVRLTGRADGTYTDTERRLGQVWGQALGLRELDIDDDFFELGGNSIIAIRAEVELERLGLALPADALYRYRSIRQAAERLTAGSDLPPLPSLPSLPGGDSPQAAPSRSGAVSEPFAAGLADPAAAAALETHERTERRVLTGIEPFNEVFYRNCFYNSMFPVAAYFNGSFLPFLLNDLIVYAAERGEAGADAGEEVRYGIKYMSAEPLETVFGRAGFGAEPRFGSDDIVGELIRGIERGRPAVLWVDCWHLSIRKDAYMKAHFDHTLLICGYDRQAEAFHAIEHDRRENLSYRHCQIPFSDIRSGFESYLAAFAAAGEPSHYLFHAAEAGGPEPAEALLRRFADLIRASEDSIRGSLDALRRFAADFALWTGSEPALQAQLDGLIAFANEVVNAKHVERYRLARLFGEQSAVCRATDETIAKWDAIRKALVRYLYMPVYNAESLNAAQRRLVELEAGEVRFYDLLRAALAAAEPGPSIREETADR